MRILHTVEFYHPSKGGAQEVVRQVSEQLVKRGHQVCVATTRLEERGSRYINGVQIEEFRISGNVTYGLQGELERYQKFLVEGQFDVMMNYAAQEWTADLAFPLLDRLSIVKVLVPCGFSGLYHPAYQRYYEEMPKVMQKYDALVFHASQYRDIEFAREHVMRHMQIIPNGASREEFETSQPSFRKRYHVPEQTPLLLSVGSHTGYKGHDVVLKAFHQARISSATLALIGNTPDRGGCWMECKIRSTGINLSGLGRKRVILLDPPRSELVAAYQAADLFVFASNIEYSPLVLFEAMASHTPFLSNACGNAAEIAGWSKGGIIVETEPWTFGRVKTKPEILARAIKDLLKKPDLRQQMANAGYAAWQERFTWEKIAREYEELYMSLLEKRVK